YTASAAVRADQETAVANWFSGDVASGRRPGAIRAPTLVADGADDALNPVSNDRMLARLVPHASLVLYPGAGHGFLFQDARKFVAALGSFLGPSSTPGRHERARRAGGARAAQRSRRERRRSASTVPPVWHVQ
ncbi:MAG: alpha/beta fold hydrolase, partial [Acidimicrobiales bacterium]